MSFTTAALLSAALAGLLVWLFLRGRDGARAAELSAARAEQERLTTELAAARAESARLAAGDSLWDAARYANAAAALSSTGFGAVAPLPGPDAVRRLLAAALG